jgi:hypothetical protein
MDDFITLSCPSCGAPLIIKEGAEYYTCEYCGRHHKIRPEDKEFYAKCPLCKRNDKVEKLTAIYQSNNYSYEYLAPPKHPDKLLTCEPNPKPQPPRNFNKKEKPDYPSDLKKLKISLILFIIVCIIMLSKIVEYFISWNDTIDRICWGSIIFIIFIYLLVGSFKTIKKMKELQENFENANKEYEENQRKITLEKEKHEKAIKEWEAYKRQYDKEFDQKRSQLMELYNKAMERYNKLYYCQRDDCVFIPGQRDYVQSSDIKNFIWGEYIKYS